MKKGQNVTALLEQIESLKNENEKLERKLLLANEDIKFARERFYGFVADTENLIKGIKSSPNSVISQITDFENSTLLVD